MLAALVTSLVAAPLVFSFTVEASTAHPIANASAFYKPARIVGRIDRIFRGQLDLGTGEKFDLDVEYYEGPVRKRPAGLWVNDLPRVGETILLFSAQPGTVAELLGKRGGEQATARRPWELDREECIAFGYRPHPASYEAAVKGVAKVKKGATGVEVRARLGEPMVGEKPNVWEYWLGGLPGYPSAPAPDHAVIVFDARGRVASAKLRDRTSP